MMKPAKPRQRPVTKATPKAKTARQIVAEQEKAARILARETRRNESDDRFTPLELIRPIELSFGKIESIHAGIRRAPSARPGTWTSAKAITG